MKLSCVCGVRGLVFGDLKCYTTVTTSIQRNLLSSSSDLCVLPSQQVWQDFAWWNLCTPSPSVSLWKAATELWLTRKVPLSLFNSATHWNCTFNPLLTELFLIWKLLFFKEYCIMFIFLALLVTTGLDIPIGYEYLLVVCCCRSFCFDYLFRNERKPLLSYLKAPPIHETNRN